MENKNLLSTLNFQREQWIRMHCDSWNLYKYKLIKLKPLSCKTVPLKTFEQKNTDEVALLVDFVVCAIVTVSC